FKLSSDKKPRVVSEDKIRTSQAVYKGRTATSWRSLMEWPELSSSLVAYNYPLLTDPDPASVPVLVELIQDTDWRVQITAIECLQQLGPKSRIAVPELCRLLQTHLQKNGLRPIVVYYTLDALEAIGTAAALAISPLTELLSDSNHYIRLHA